MKKNSLLTIIGLLVISTLCFADTIFVPGDQPTIQAGIDAAAEGDTVFVAPGSYLENIKIIGKGIILKSENGPKATIIDGNAVDAVVEIRDNTNLESVIDGFTITNGKKKYGSGIFCEKASPLISNNIISDNSFSAMEYLGSFFGAGICCRFGSPRIKNNIIKNNSLGIWGFDAGGDGCGSGIYCSFGSPIIEDNLVENNSIWTGFTASVNYLYGAGIYCVGASPQILNNVIRNNELRTGGVVKGGSFGGGIAFVDSNGLIRNNLIYGNEAKGDNTARGGGFYCKDSYCDFVNNTVSGNRLSDVWERYGAGIYSKSERCLIVNCIIWGNKGAKQVKGMCTVSHSCIQRGFPGTCNLDRDPGFVDVENNDFHIKYDSPCRDCGSNAAISSEANDFEGDPRIVNGHVDIGADEFGNHLYFTGEFAPDNPIEGKFVGLPNTWPVGIFLGSDISDNPLQNSWGDFYLQQPWYYIPLVPIPAEGVLVTPARLPPIPAPYDIPMQALIGWELSNLFVLEVR